MSTLRKMIHDHPRTTPSCGATAPPKIGSRGRSGRPWPLTSLSFYMALCGSIVLPKYNRLLGTQICKLYQYRHLLEMTSCNISITWRYTSCNVYVTEITRFMTSHVSWRSRFVQTDVVCSYVNWLYILRLVNCAQLHHVTAPSLSIESSRRNYQ
jgi:hypothetical protein